MTTTTALAEVLSLFERQDKWTNKEIAAELGITYPAAYKRTYRLRKAGLLNSYPDWKTINGQAAYRDEYGNMRSWLVLFVPKKRTVDTFQSVFDPRRNRDEGRIQADQRGDEGG